MNRPVIGLCLLIGLATLGLTKALRARQARQRPTKAYLIRSLVSFESEGPKSVVHQCGGVFVTRQHVLTTLRCALSTKRHQLIPRRLHGGRRSKASVSTEADGSRVSGNFDLQRKKMRLTEPKLQLAAVASWPLKKNDSSSGKQI